MILGPVLLSQVPRIGQLAKNYLSHKPTFHLNNFERIVQLAVCITFHNPALGVVRILGLRKERKTLFCIFDFFPTLQERFSAWCCWWSGLEKKEKKLKITMQERLVTWRCWWPRVEKREPCSRCCCELWPSPAV